MADLFLGIAIGLLVGAVVVSIVNQIWYRQATRISEEWAEFCKPEPGRPDVSAVFKWADNA